MNKLPLRHSLFAFASNLLYSEARVRPDELKAMLAGKDPVVLIDVRTPEEHVEARIPGSILMPLDTLECVRVLPSGGRVVLYCRAGVRSLRAIDVLSAKGFKGLTDLEGGIKAWVDSGGSVVSGVSGPAK